MSKLGGKLTLRRRTLLDWCAGNCSCTLAHCCTLATVSAGPKLHCITATLQVEWKLTRGKWRPKLLDYAKDALEQSVVDATRKAYASLGTAASPHMQHVEEALEELTSLKVRLQQPVSDISCLVEACSGSAVYCQTQICSCGTTYHCPRISHTHHTDACLERPPLCASLQAERDTACHRHPLPLHMYFAFFEVITA